MAHILVVEDDADSAEVLCAYLGKAGHQVDYAPNGHDAMNFLLTRTPDLLVTDLLMPAMNGSTLVEVVRSYLRLKSIPVIVYTGVAEGALAAQAWRHNVSAILTKGKHGLDDVLRAVEQALTRRSADNHPPTEPRWL